MGTTESSPDVGALRRCISDVVALSTLSAVWAGATRPEDCGEPRAGPARNARRGRRLRRPTRDGWSPPCDSVCQSRSAEPAYATRSAQTSRPGCSQPGPVGSLPGCQRARQPLLVTPIGIYAEHGVIVTVSSRDDFPSETRSAAAEHRREPGDARAAHRLAPATSSGSRTPCSGSGPPSPRNSIRRR